jgi:hypothetical protein
VGSVWSRQGGLTIAAKVIASCFALTAFAAAVALGVAAGNSAGTILLRALVTLAVCWPVGFLVGRLAEHIVELNIRQYKDGHPITADEAPATADATAAEDGAPTESKLAPPPTGTT